MDQLWAPWRLSYVKQAPKPEERILIHNCFICQGLSESNDAENLIVERNTFSLILLNKFPYNNGHLLVAPLRHIGKINELEPQEWMEINLNLAKMVQKLEELMKPDGFNIGLNLGSVAGAGLPGHIHWHIVPRWNGDTNFMPVIADTKVIVQSLHALYSLLANSESNL